MRLHVLADLHLEFGPIDIPDTDADAVVFAGDVGVCARRRERDTKLTDRNGSGPLAGGKKKAGGFLLRPGLS